MCTALETLKKEGIQESIQETISKLQELDIPKDVIIKKSKRNFS